MKNLRTILFTLLGAGVAYFILKKTETPTKTPALKEEEKYITISLPPIYLPKNVSESKVRELAEKLTPKVKPSLRPLGVKLYWTPIALELPIGKVYITPPEKFIPAVTLVEAYRIAREFKPTIEDKGIYWAIKFPKIRIKVR